MKIVIRMVSYVGIALISFVAGYIAAVLNAGEPEDPNLIALEATRALYKRDLFDMFEEPAFSAYEAENATRILQELAHADVALVQEYSRSRDADLPHFHRRLIGLYAGEAERRISLFEESKDPQDLQQATELLAAIDEFTEYMTLEATDLDRLTAMRSRVQATRSDNN